MTTMFEDGMAKCLTGVTSAAEVFRVTTTRVRSCRIFRCPHYDRKRRSRQWLNRCADLPAEVARRIDYLRLVPIDLIVEESAARASRLNFSFERRVRAEDVTIFTLDLALLLKAGARLDRALRIARSNSDIDRLRSTAGAIR